MKISLIFPGVIEHGFNSVKKPHGNWMNHGLALISASLKKQGHQVDLIDLRELSGWDEFEAQIQSFDSMVVGITMMSLDFEPALQAAKIIKKHRPNVKILVGGPHPSICPEEVSACEEFDFIFKGEAEKSIPQLMEKIEKGEVFPRIISGEISHNLDDIEWADRDLFHFQETSIFPKVLPDPFVTLIASRGCRYNCNYCQPSERLIFGNKVRRRSPRDIVNELKYLQQKYHFNSFMIHDDCLTEDRKWVMEFCQKLKEAGIHKPFFAQSRADIICKHPDMIRALKLAGLEVLIVGFESGSDRVLKFLRKGCTRKQNLQAASICRKLEIKVWANYMLGLPTETKQEALETLSMLKKIKPYHCSPAFYTPHPGSDLYEMGEKMGLHFDHADHSLYCRGDFKPKIKGVDYQFLQELLRKSVMCQQASRSYRIWVKNRLVYLRNRLVHVKNLLIYIKHRFVLRGGFIAYSLIFHPLRSKNILIRRLIPVQYSANVTLNFQEMHELPLCLKSKPLLVYAEVSTRCNIKCRMCGKAVHTINPADEGLMSKRTFKKLAKALSPGTKLAMFGRGETLLHPDFIYFLKLAKKKSAHVSFNTNGQSLSNKISKAMVQYGQDVLTISCSAGSKETYEKIHCGGKWDLLWENVSGLLKARQAKFGSKLEGCPLIYLEFVVQKDNIQELPELVQRSIEWGLQGLMAVDLVANVPALKGQQMNTPENQSLADEYYRKAREVKEKVSSLNPRFVLSLPEDYHALTKKVLSDEEKTKFNVLEQSWVEKFGACCQQNMCLEPWQTLYARFNGKVSPCCITNRNLGDLSDSTAEMIWNGSLFSKFRERMRSDNKPFECLRCHFFSGCQEFNSELADVEKYEPL